MRQAVRRLSVAALVVVVCSHAELDSQSNFDPPPDGLRPGTRVLLDAHNAYPEHGRWSDRLDRALATGAPLAIEQDLLWVRDRQTGRARSIVSHGEPFTGREPSLDEYFFTRIKPLVERAFRENRRERWPVVTLNLDFKSDEPEHHRAVWDLLGRHEDWLVTASRTRDVTEIAPLRPAPLLVLTGEADAQERSFHDAVPVGGKLRLFGAAHASPDGVPRARSNYRRWANYPWSAVEPEGQSSAGAWTDADEARLRWLVQAAHARDLWIRFYTLNGHDPADRSMGWTASYNFGGLAAVRARWEAAIRTGVDFIAVDQYEAFAATRHATASSPTRTFEGTLTRDDYERFIEHTFEVPAGTERVDMTLTYDDRDRTVIDLGVAGPDAFRGWSGGGSQRIHISTYSASYGYTPGPLEPGRWTVILGVPNIRAGVTTSYRIDVRLSESSTPGIVLSPAPRWYAGDLHAHSGHSDGRTTLADGSRARVPAQRVFDAAARERLDFLALSDHNTASHWADVDRLQPLYPSMLLLHAREITTYRGHFNSFGERRFVDFRLGRSRSMADVASDHVRAGAWLSINHPTRPDDERCMGCGWNDRDRETMSRVHGVEIVNGDGVDDPLSGWRFWAAMLNMGHRLVAIGGSDEHTPDETSDRRIGTPTTVVYAQELSETAIVDGLRSGRVYVRTRAATGPMLEFSARQNGVVTAMGGSLNNGTVTLEVTSDRAGGQRLDWIRRGEVVRSVTVPTDGRASFTIDTRPNDWFSVVLSDNAGPTLFANAIYVD